MSSIDALIDEIQERMEANGAEFVFEVHPAEGVADQPLAFGFILHGPNGSFMTGEIGLDVAGQPQLTASSWGGDGERLPTTVLEFDGSLIIGP